MHKVWKKVDGVSWESDAGNEELDRLKREGFIPVESVKPEPVLNEHAYLILYEPQMRAEEQVQYPVSSRRRE